MELDCPKVLEQFLDRFPQEWRDAVIELKPGLDQLAQERAPAFYGDEVAGVQASALFGETATRRAIAIADRLLDLCRRLLGDRL